MDSDCPSCNLINIPPGKYQIEFEPLASRCWSVVKYFLNLIFDCCGFFFNKCPIISRRVTTCRFLHSLSRERANTVCYECVSTVRLFSLYSLYSQNPYMRSSVVRTYSELRPCLRCYSTLYSMCTTHSL